MRVIQQFQHHNQYNVIHIRLLGSTHRFPTYSESTSHKTLLKNIIIPSLNTIYMFLIPTTHSQTHKHTHRTRTQCSSTHASSMLVTTHKHDSTWEMHFVWWCVSRNKLVISALTKFSVCFLTQSLWSTHEPKKCIIGWAQALRFSSGVLLYMSYVGCGASARVKRENRDEAFHLNLVCVVVVLVKASAMVLV